MSLLSPATATANEDVPSTLVVQDDDVDVDAMRKLVGSLTYVDPSLYTVERHIGETVFGARFMK